MPPPARRRVIPPRRRRPTVVAFCNSRAGRWIQPPRRGAYGAGSEIAVRSHAVRRKGRGSVPESPASPAPGALRRGREQLRVPPRTWKSEAASTPDEGACSFTRRSRADRGPGPWPPFRTGPRTNTNECGRGGGGGGGLGFARRAGTGSFGGSARGPTAPPGGSYLTPFPASRGGPRRSSPGRTGCRPCPRQAVRAAEDGLDPVLLRHVETPALRRVRVVADDGDDLVALVEDDQTPVQVRHGDVVTLDSSRGRHPEASHVFAR